MQLSLGLSMCSSSGGMAGVNAQLATLLSSALIPSRDGVVTVTRAGVEPNPMGGADAAANTANTRTLNVGGYSIPGAAYLCQGASTGLYGAASSSFALASNATAAGAYPTVRTITEDTGNSLHHCFASAVLLTDGVTYTASFLVKRAVGSRNCGIQVAVGGNSANANLNMDTGAVNPFSSGTATVVRSSAVLLPTGFWLLQMSFSATAWGGSAFFYLRMILGATGTYTGDGASSLSYAGYRVSTDAYATGPGAWDGDTVARIATSISWNQTPSTTAGTIIAIGKTYGRGAGVGPATDASFLFATSAESDYQVISTAIYASDKTDSLIAVKSALSAATPAAIGQQMVLTNRWDSSSNRLTINAVTTSSGAPGGGTWSASSAIIIGNSVVLTSQYEGWVALLKFSTVLSDADVALIAAYSSIV